MGGSPLDDLLSIIALSLAPGLLWLWFFTRYDPQPEPDSRLLVTFALGGLATLPAALLEAPFSPLLRGGPWPVQLVTLVAVVGLGEELAKAAALYVGGVRTRAFDQVVDGIMYSTAAALGFAVVENVFYGRAFGLEVAPVRAGLASLAHVAFSGLVGYGAGIYRMGYGDRLAPAAGLLQAALFHGLYNFLLLRPLLPAVLVPLLPGVLLILLFRRIGIARALDAEADEPAGRMAGRPRDPL